MARSKPRLTDEQKAMVEQNLLLVYSALKLHPKFVQRVGRDEAISFGYLTLCNAVRTHRPEKGELSTHMYSAIAFKIRTYWEQIQADSIARPDSLEGIDALVSHEDDRGPIEGRDFVQSCLRWLHPSERTLFELYSRGMTSVQIAQQLGREKNAVWQHLLRIFKKIKRRVAARPVRGVA